MAKKYNFYAGPAILPQEVMKKAQDELLDFNGIGLSIMEISHRSKDFEAVITTAEAKIRSLLGVPENYTVMFLQGGASLQFGMIPMNLLKGKKADYVHTGEWAKKAIKEAKLFGTVNVAGTSEDKNFSYIPENLKLSPDAQYVHITSNETIGGIQWSQVPRNRQCSPDHRHVFGHLQPPHRFQEHRADLCRGAEEHRPGRRHPGHHAQRPGRSLRRRPDHHAQLQNPRQGKIAVQYPALLCHLYHQTGHGLDRRQWRFGGIEKINNEKAKTIYDAIDNSNGYYKGTAAIKDRSKMNVTFRLPSEELEEKFVNDAKKAGFIGLKGHRSVGGCRASLYNAMSLAGVSELTKFMEKFARENK